MYQFIKELVLALLVVWAMIHAMHSSGMSIETKTAYKAIAGGK